MNDTAVQAAVEAHRTDEFEALRERCRDLMARESLSQAALGRQLGVAEQTFSAWVNDKYNGRNDVVADKVRIGLSSLEARARASSTLPPDIAFQDTPTARKILTLLQFAQSAPDIVVVAAGAGVGKTATADHYARTNANVWKVTAQPCTATVYPMLGKIAAVMKLEEKVQTKLPDAIEKFVAGKDGLLIVDEAQHLDSRALDQLRSLPDAVDVGLALIGNERVYGRLEGGGRRAEFAQLFSRVGMTLTQARPRTDDVNALIDAWGIGIPEEKKLLRHIASKPGALRGMTKTLRLATMMAGGAEGRTIDHIRAAYTRLSPQTVGQD